jgi:hypothetical protein
LINPIFYLVLLTFVNSVFFLNKKTLSNRILFYIIGNYFLTELVSIFLNYNIISVDILYNISIAIQFVLWIYLLLIVINVQNKLILYLFIVLIIFSLINHFNDFNSNNFILGSAVYSIIYIFESYKLLKNENLSFFQTNNYLIITSPIIFFFGMSFMFAFNSHDLTSCIVFANVKLYTFISYFVNIIYYSLINLYIYKERKLQNG